MMELVVISGKGGTGKTSLLASLAVLAHDAVVADCDVDAPDLHLVLDPSEIQRHDFISGFSAVVEPDRCTGCGLCESHCRFAAVSCPADGTAVFHPLACEGCGVCARVCPEEAIRMVPRHAGEWVVSRTRCGPLVHARLEVGGSSSGRLVAVVRQQARTIAQLERRDLVLVDGPPGVGCPVIASLTGASAVLVVTEPTPAGAHDLARVLELAGHFKVPAAVCVNRWDLHPEGTDTIEAQARRSGASVAGRVRYDPQVTAAQVAAVSVVEHGGGAADDIVGLWASLRALWPDLAAARPLQARASATELPMVQS